MTTPTLANPVVIDVRLADALAQVGYLPAAIQGAARAAAFDMLSHHRLSVIKNARTWPGGRRAQAMTASRLHRFSKDNEQNAGVTGQGFAAAVTGQTFGSDAFVREEAGQSITAGGYMALPVGAGAEMVKSNIAGRRQQFRDLVASRALSIIPVRGALLLVQKLAGRGKAQKGLRERVLAVLIKRRTEPGRLKFYPTWERIQSEDTPKLEKILSLATTEAGRVKLAERNRAGVAGRAAYTSTFREFLSTNPRRFAQARQVATAAAAAARNSVISGAGGRA